MEDNLDILVEHYYQEKKQGVGFSEIRKELELKQYDKEFISHLIREVDDLILEDELHRSKQFKIDFTLWGGYALFFGGAIITVDTYIGFLNQGGSYLIVWAPVLSGYFMIKAAKRMKKKSLIRDKRRTKQKGWFQGRKVSEPKYKTNFWHKPY